MRSSTIVVCIASVATLLLLGGVAVYAAGPATVDLGAADSFGVLAGTTVTNTGASIINGDLGVSPGTAVTGFPPGTMNGTMHVGDGTAAQAQADLLIAYDDAAGRALPSTVAAELGGTTVTPGLYDSADGTFGISGILTLDALGDSSAVFIFRTATTLITAGGSEIVLAGGADACNVFWQIGSSATVASASIFKGNILAYASVALGTGAAVDGRLLARSGGVTLQTNTITIATCTLVSTAVGPPTESTTWGSVKAHYR